MSRRPDYEVLAKLADSAEELSTGPRATVEVAALALLVSKLAGELAHWSASPDSESGRVRFELLPGILAVWVAFMLLHVAPLLWAGVLVRFGGGR